MARTRRPSASTTPPKGRPTAPRDSAAARSDRWVTLQWVGVALLVAAVVVVAVYIGAGQDPQPLHGGR